TELIQAERATVVPHAPPAAIYDEAERIARHVGGFYLDHFTHAPTAATDPDWPVAHDLVGALTTATGSPPTVLIAGLGSGATAAGLHAHRRRNRLAYRIVGVDAENSAYLPGWLYGVADYGTGMPTRIEGLGRPVLPGSFEDRKSTRLNSSHVSISYAVFCLKKKKTNIHRESKRTK